MNITPRPTGFKFGFGTTVQPAPFDIGLQFVEKEREERFEYGVPTPQATHNDSCFDK